MGSTGGGDWDGGPNGVDGIRGGAVCGATDDYAIGGVRGSPTLLSKVSLFQHEIPKP